MNLNKFYNNYACISYVHGQKLRLHFSMFICIIHCITIHVCQNCCYFYFIESSRNLSDDSGVGTNISYAIGGLQLAAILVDIAKHVHNSNFKKCR